MGKSSKRGKLSGNVARELSDGRSFAGQQRTTLRLEGQPILLSTTVTTGVVASVYNISCNSIVGFTTRFGSTFDECRVLSARFRITAVSASTGVTKMWFDEKASASPSANEAQERTSQPFANTNANSKSRNSLTWKARDLLDLQYSPIGSVATPAYFKIYTDTTTWGAPATVTPLWLIEPVFTVEFRGIKST